MEGKRVMVVGGTGKIGKHLVPKLVRLGNEVHAVARFGRPAQREALERLGVRCFATDVACPGAFHGIPNDYNVVLHEAALKFGSEDDLESTVEINVRAVGLAMEHFAGTRAFLFASSGNVYADGVAGASKAAIPRPPSFYAMTRLGGEWMVDYFSRRNATPAVIQRIFYGYHEEFGVPTDIARQVRDGEPVDLATEFVNVIWLDDLMDKMIESWQVAACPPRILNLDRHREGLRPLDCRAARRADGEGSPLQRHAQGHVAPRRRLRDGPPARPAEDQPRRRPPPPRPLGPGPRAPARPPDHVGEAGRIWEMRPCPCRRFQYLREGIDVFAPTG